jgi:DNA repair protein RecO
MPHHIYTTPGFLVHSASHSEAGKFFLVFTRELGMIGCVAQGVRLSQSKLRYYTQDYSFSLFSLVRGKDVWRLVGAKEMDGLGEVKEGNKKLYVQILALLRRLLPGEEKNEKVFGILENFYKYLSEKELEKEDKVLVEYLTVLRILYSLGYVKNSLGSVLDGEDLDDLTLFSTGDKKEVMLKEINEGLKQSQL